jgi:hypothetical protein
MKKKPRKSAPVSPPTPVRGQASDHPVRSIPAAVVAVLLALLAVAAFFPVLRNGFIETWDDQANILENDGYRGLGWAQIQWAWTNHLVGVYQPLGWMILSLQYVLWKLDPWGYHLTSLLFHAANTVVLYFLTLTLLSRCLPDVSEKARLAFAVSCGLAVALFAVHPLRTEVVAWVSCQTYLPCALFALLTVLAYLRACRPGPSRRAAWLIGALLLFSAALLSKAPAVTLPAVLLLLDI